MRFLEATDPAVRVLAVVLAATPLMFSVDVVSAGVGLAVIVALLLMAGFGPRRLWRAGWPLFIAAPVAALSMLLYGEPSGRIYFSWLLVAVSDGSIELALAAGLRVFAMALPVVMVFATLDPTRLADSLSQVIRMPSRFVLGALAGLRTVGLMQADWRTLGHARRARGLGDAGRFRRWATMAFALLVFAIRRGSRFATAMEARGFGAGRRTWARSASLSWRDPVLLMVAVLIPTVALGAAWWCGTLNTIWN